MSSDDRAAETTAPPPETPGSGCPIRGRRRDPGEARLEQDPDRGRARPRDLRPRHPRAASSSRRTPRARPASPVQGISDLILANLELPAPEVVLPRRPRRSPPGIVFFDVSITNTIVTTWLVIAVVLLIAVIVRLTMRWLPGGFQNFVEWAYEGARGLGGRPRRRRPLRRHIPLFVAFFLFILFSNWSGLIPLFGKVEFLRAPDERRERDDRPRPRRVLLLPVPGLPGARRPRLPRQVLQLQRVQGGHRRRPHRPLRRPHRVHARVHQARHAGDATLRQHLRRRGRARRDHGADDRRRPGRDAAARGAS